MRHGKKVSFKQQSTDLSSSNNKGRRSNRHKGRLQRCIVMKEWKRAPKDRCLATKRILRGASVGSACARFDWLPAGRRQPKITEVGQGVCIHFVSLETKRYYPQASRER